MSERKIRAGSEGETQTFQARTARPRLRAVKVTGLFGEKGTNKLMAQLKPDSGPSEETAKLERTRFIADTPSTRG